MHCPQEPKQHGRANVRLENPFYVHEHGSTNDTDKALMKRSKEHANTLSRAKKRVKLGNLELQPVLLEPPEQDPEVDPVFVEDLEARL